MFGGALAGLDRFGGAVELEEADVAEIGPDRDVGRIAGGKRSSRGAELEPDLVEQSRALKGRGGTVWQQLARRERSTPSLLSVMVAALNITQDRITRARLAADPPDVTIRPDLGHIGLLEFDRAAEAIEAGERAAEHAISELRAILTGGDPAA